MVRSARLRSQVARRAFPSRGAPRRKTIWVGASETVFTTVTSGASLLLSSFAPDALSILAATVVRVRGLFQVQPNSFAADLDYDGAYGLAVVSDEALAAGAASIPRPFDDDDWTGWLVHGYYSQHFMFDNTASGYLEPATVIDSKAMRKVRPNEALVWMVESRTGAVKVQIPARVLMMLS